MCFLQSSVSEARMGYRLQITNYTIAYLKYWFLVVYKNLIQFILIYIAENLAILRDMHFSACSSSTLLHKV